MTTVWGTTVLRGISRKSKNIVNIVYLHGHWEVILCLRWEEHVNGLLGVGLVTCRSGSYFYYMQLERAQDMTQLEMNTRTYIL